MFYCYKFYEYQTPWPFVFFGNSALLGMISFRETGIFRDLSALKGTLNCLAYFYIDLDCFIVLVNPF